MSDHAVTPSQPLSGCRVVERSRTVAAAYAGRLLAAMGADVLMLEQGGESALFAYLSVGKRSLVCDPALPEGLKALEHALNRADILIDDTALHDRAAMGLTPETVGRCYPKLVHVSVLPFGAMGPKAEWDGEEINLLHAGGEGYLLPNGLSDELFPDRSPLKIYGHFAGYQGGSVAALAALTSWWAVPVAGAQYVDVSVQDAVLSVGAFALQRLGDGSLEHRKTRRFRYGGVFEAQDGFIELLTLEDRQWSSLVELLGNPEWAANPALRDPLERSCRGDDINRHIRAWMARHPVEDIVRRAQELGVPAGKYRTPVEVYQGEHERARGLFAPAVLEDGTQVEVLVAPFKFCCSPLSGGSHVPALNEMAQEMRT